MKASVLADRAVFAVTGADARDFLQGLVTKNMRKMEAGKPVFAALLSPQGRFLFDFFILEHEGRFLFDTDKARLSDLIKRLTLYRLRSRVEFTPLPQMQVSAYWDGTPEAGPLTYADPRLSELGWRAISESPVAAQDDYTAHRVALGVPEGSRDLTFDRSLPLEYGYDELQAIDFDKGCYVGQEVTARTKHRAVLRKFIYGVRGEEPLAPPGTPVFAGEREAGTMLSTAGHRGIAHMRVEEVERAARENVALKAGERALDVQFPFWRRTQFA